jgi:hypothetical protein
VHNWAVSAFRRRHRLALNDAFTQVLEWTRSQGMGKLGRVAIDSTRIAANASRERVDTEHALRDTRARLRRQVRIWQKQADRDDQEPSGLEVTIGELNQALAEMPRRLRGVPHQRRDAVSVHTAVCLIRLRPGRWRSQSVLCGFRASSRLG